MKKGGRPRVLVVVKTTSYQRFVAEKKDPRTTELLARNDPAVGRLRGAHMAHETTVNEVLEAIESLGATAHAVTTSTLVETTPDDFDLVVTVGGDGTLLTASHGVGATTPILGINSAPDHSVGFFCGAQKGGVLRGVTAALDGTMRRTVVSRMEVLVNDVSLSSRILNDALFCHEVPAATSRYILSIDPGRGTRRGALREEEQKSSGLWIGPAAGSTAAQRSAGGRVLPLTSERIQYVVREPYTPTGAPLALRQGVIDAGGSIMIRSKMHQAKLFLDGPHVVHEAGLGDILTLRRSNEPLTVLGLSRRTVKAKPRSGS